MESEHEPETQTSNRIMKLIRFRFRRSSKVGSQKSIMPI